jgi:carbohydrate diacid regulator
MRQLAVGCLDQLTNRLGMQILAGIGPSANTLAGLRDSYTDAVDAVRLGARRSGMKMVAVERVRAAQLIANVGHRARARYVLSVASRLTAQPDWRTLRETVVAWCDSGFSLIRAADALAIHRNTLVYRLEKIEQLQGWTCRSGRDYIALYLACIADQVEH